MPKNEIVKESQTKEDGARERRETNQDTSYASEYFDLKKIEKLDWKDLNKYDIEIKSLSEDLADNIRNKSIPGDVLAESNKDYLLSVFFSLKFGIFPNVITYDDDRINIQKFIEDFISELNISKGYLEENSYYENYTVQEYYSIINNGIIMCKRGPFLRFYYDPQILETGYAKYSKKNVSELEVLKSFIRIIKNYIKPKVNRNKIHIIYNDGDEIRKKAFTPKNQQGIDIKKNYNNDFEDVSNNLIEKLNDQSKNGLFILSGEPGTGKTTYLRYLTQHVKRNIFYIPPDMVEILTNPSFIGFLFDNPNSVFLIEDAESALQKREANEVRSGMIANVLNMTDGLLSDCLNISIVATFNTKTKNLDDALLRKGRMLGSYEFKKLSIDKAQKLVDEIGLNINVTSPMTLSEIYYYNEKNNNELFTAKSIKGFNNE